MSADTVRLAATTTYRLVRNLHGRLSTIDRYQNPDLTAEALEKTKLDSAARTLAYAKQRADALLKEATRERDAAEAKVQPLRPAVDANNQAALTRTAQAWDMIIRPMRDAGRSWREIIEASDWDMMQALSRFMERTIRIEELPTNSQLVREPSRQGDFARVEDMLGNLAVAMDHRTAEIHPDPTARALFEDARGAQDALTAVQAITGALNYPVQHAKDLTPAMVAGKSYLHPLGLLPAEPPLTDEQQDNLATTARIRGLTHSAVALTLVSPNDWGPFGAAIPSMVDLETAQTGS